MTAQPAANTQDARDTREPYGWYVVFILCLCGMVAYVDRSIINLLVEDIKRDLSLNDTQISLLQGLAFALFYAVMAVPLGRLSDTSNRRIIVSVGIVVWTLAAMACGLARSFWQLFAARTMVGVGEATLTPAGFSLLADLFIPNKLALPVSVFTGSSFFGSGLALLLGGLVIAYIASLDTVSLPLVGVVAPWQAAFVVAALPGLALALVFFLTIKEPARRIARDSTATLAAADKPTLRDLWAHCHANGRVFAAVFIGVSFLAAAQFALGAWVPAFFIRQYGWTSSEVAYAYGWIFLLCGTGGVVGGGWLTNRWLKRRWRDAHLRVALLSAVATAPFIVACALAEDAAWSVAYLASAVLFGTIAFGAGPSLLPVISPPRMRALIVALYLLVANIIGQAGGPALVAIATDYVFGAPELVRYSLALVPPILLAIGAVVIARGRGPLRAVLEQHT